MYHFDQYGIQQSLDKLLKQSEFSVRAALDNNPSAAMLAELQKSFDNTTKNNPLSAEESYYYHYFQVWNHNNQLVLQSPRFDQATLNFINSPLGFSNQRTGNQTWRVFSTMSSDGKYKIAIGEQVAARNNLSWRLIHDNTYIMALTYLVVVILIWFVIWRGFDSIRRVANEVSHRAHNFLEPVNVQLVPVEIKPLVTELNKLFLRLQQAFEREQRFAADAAHELRTPLAAIKTQAQVALNLREPVALQQVLNNVIIGVDRAAHIVQQLLAMSRLPEHDTLEDISEINLNQLSQEMASLLMPLAKAKDISIITQYSENDIKVLGNKMAMSILIRNLIDNAIRYTPEHGHIEVFIGYEGNHPILRVSDNGPGIAVELRSRVFERFYRVLGNTASGSGLGLSIVQQIAKLHHAEVTLGAPLSGSGLEVKVEFDPDAFID